MLTKVWIRPRQASGTTPLAYQLPIGGLPDDVPLTRVLSRSPVARHAHRGQELGREITRLVLGWAFGTLGMHRVELEVLASNQRAIGCYRACGFRREGIRRQAGSTQTVGKISS